MWRPIHEAHAIERVRLTVAFAEPLPTKVLQKLTGRIIPRHRELGFDAVGKVYPQPKQFVLKIGDGPPQVSGPEGLSLQRKERENVVEDALFTADFFGYTTLEYIRWDAFSNRVRELFEQPISQLTDFVDVQSIKLEYWDRFVSEFGVDAADARDMLEIADFGIPKEAQGAGKFWHSHCGWFRESHSVRFLVNRNVSVADRVTPEGAKHMTVNLHTFVERRASEAPIDGTAFFEILDTAHAIANLTLGDVLKEPMRERIGLRLEAYTENA